MAARISGLFLVLALAACSGGGDAPTQPTPPAPDVPPEATAWLKANAIPFNTSQAGGPNAEGRVRTRRGRLSSSLLAAFALMLVLEGILPFLMPGVWRETFRRLTEMTDGQIRFMGLSSMLVGLLLLYRSRRPRFDGPAS